MANFINFEMKGGEIMKEPTLVSGTVLCLVDTAVAFAAIGACTATAVYAMCGALAVIG